MSGIKPVSHRVKVDDVISTRKGEIDIMTGQIDKDKIVKTDVGDIEATEVSYEADPNAPKPENAVDSKPSEDTHSEKAEINNEKESKETNSNSAVTKPSAGI
jgi:hypothetical protein